MCGIIAQIKKNDDGVPTHDTIKGMLTSQINRGTEGFGYISFDDNINAYVRRENRYQIEAVMDKNKSRSIIFHHRIPTSTPNFADCAHPIKVSHAELKHDYYLVHNGMISNHSILYQEHTELGYEYMTQVESTIKTKNAVSKRVVYNDSEALAIDVARFIENKQTRIKSRGSIAFIVAQVDKKTEKVLNIYFGRNSSPLTINVTENSIVLRSEGETENCLMNYLYKLDMDTFTITKEYCPIGELISVRNDISQGYPYGGVTDTSSREYDFDPDYRVSNNSGPSNLPVYRGGTTTQSTTRVIEISGEESDEEIADSFIAKDIAKLDALLEELDDRWGILQDDLLSMEQNPEGLEVQIAETERQLKEIEEDMDKFETDRELLISGDFSDVISSE